MSGVRGALAGAVGSQAVRNVLTPLLRNYANVSTQFATANDGPIEETDPSRILSGIYLHFIKQSLSVNSRNITFAATPSAGSNLGSGAINRLTVDAYGHNIEACHVESKQARCIGDATTGEAPGEEVFQFRGSTRPVDQLQLPATATITGGSGGEENIAAVSGRSSMLANPSFEQFAGTSITVLTSITGWTVGAETISNYNLVEGTSNIYRTYQGITTPRAVKFLAAGSLSQTTDINNIQFNENVPYYFQIAYNRSVGSATGTLTITLGNTTASVVLSAQSGWNLLKLPMTKAIWPHQFAATAIAATGAALLTIKIQWASATGTLLVDEAILCPMSQFDGHWYTVVGGATNFVADNRDTFTWSDVLAGTDSIIQQWLWRSFGFYLPSNNAGAETWVDPTV